MEQLGEVKELVLQYARGIWKHRWIAIVGAWLVLVIGIAAVEQIDNKYRAETKVFIDSSTVLKPLLQGIAIQSDFNATVQLMAKQLLSRPNLERAAHTMNMDRNIQNADQMEDLVRKIRNETVISANRRTGIYTIAYTDTDRVRARQMVETLFNIFVEDTLGRSESESDSAIQFLNQQIGKYDQILREAEERREEFKRKNIGLMPKDGETYYAQLRQVEGQIEDAIISRAELNNRKSILEVQIYELQANSDTQQVAVKSSLDLRIEEQERQLDDLLILYTDQHPDVVNVRQVLRTLRDRKKTESAQVVSKETLINNPVYQELQISLSTTEADIASLDARLQKLNAKKRELEKLVDIVPKIEGEMQRLNRDYEVHQKNYNELVKRREQAKISEDVESDTDQVKFRIIEPAYVPLRPTSPNRVIYDLGILVVSLGIGYGLSLLVSMLQPVFYNQLDLRNVIGYPVLGAVSKFDTPNVVARRRKDLMLFGFANLLFVCVAGALIILHARGIMIFDYLETRID